MQEIFTVGNATDENNSPFLIAFTAIAFSGFIIGISLGWMIWHG